MLLLPSVTFPFVPFVWNLVSLILDRFPQFATLAALADASCLGLDHDLSQAYIRLLSTWSNIATQPYEKNAANASKSVYHTT